jgi:DNA polymerase III epsilon subunit-like protein
MPIFLDTETTGTGSDDRLCQIAFKPEVCPAVCELFNPGMPISIDAMAIHHITNKMVEDICNYAKLGMISMYPNTLEPR